MLDKIKTIWGKYGWLYALIITVVVVFGIFRQPDIKEIKVLDTKTMQTIFSKFNEMKTALVNTKTELTKEINKQKTTLLDIKSDEEVIEIYDKDTGKLIRREVRKKTENNSNITSTTASTTGSTATSTSASTTASTGTTATSTTGVTHEEDTKITSNRKLIGLYGNLRILPFKNFMADSISLGPTLNLSNNFSLNVGLSYDLKFDASFVEKLGVELGFQTDSIF
jgi:hypothetical protein